MTNNGDDSSQSDAAQLTRKASQRHKGLLSEFAGLLLHTKKWWLVPIVIVLLLVALFMVIGGTGAAPFIYTLF